MDEVDEDVCLVGDADSFQTLAISTNSQQKINYDEQRYLHAAMSINIVQSVLNSGNSNVLLQFPITLQIIHVIRAPDVTQSGIAQISDGTNSAPCKSMFCMESNFFVEGAVIQFTSLNDFQISKKGFVFNLLHLCLLMPSTKVK